MNNDLLNKYNKLYKFIKDKNIYKFFTYKYFISDEFESNNPPLFYIGKNCKNRYNMIV